jgi:glycerophosphoryl diester phosphodiesterase
VPRVECLPPPPHSYLDGPHPRAYAHRGWHLDELAGLENTLAAFRQAVDEGFDYVELDVHSTVDGVAVVHHDRTLDRTTDAVGPIAARTAAELDGVRVRGAHWTEPVPRLTDVLTALPDTRFTIEVKSGAAVPPVLAVLAELDAWDRVCVAGFHEAWLDAARSLAPDERLFTSMGHRSALGLRLRGWGVTRKGRPRGGRTVGPLAVRGDVAQLPHRIGRLTVVDADLLRVAHAGGREVHVWTVDDPDVMAWLLDLGADGIITDRPDLLRDVLHARGRDRRAS